MQVTINVPEELTSAARARGLSIEAYIEEMVARSAQKSLSEARLHEIAGAIDRLRELRNASKLDGLKIREMIQEGRKY